MILLIGSAYGEIKQNNSLEINHNITTIRNKIDSIDNVIKLYLDEELNYEYLKDFELEKHMHQISIDTLIREKILSLTKSSAPFYALRDLYLDSMYYRGYFDTRNPDTSEPLMIIPKKGVACNINTGKMIYGFANMHNRKDKLEIDFELFDRIGIYSMYPEVYGSIEMIFSENETIRVKEIPDRFIKQAHRYNTKVDLILSFHEWDTRYNLKPRIDQDAVMLNMVDSVSSIITKYNFDGITFDFSIDRMNIRDILFYKKLIYMVHKELNAKNESICINVIISLSDILDTLSYSLLQVDSAYSLQNIFSNQSKSHKNTNKIVNSSIKELKETNSNQDISTKRFTKLDLLLKPDHIEYIDYLLVNKNTDHLNLKQVSEILNTRYCINENKKVIIVMPLYTNLYRITGKKEQYCGSIIQKNFNENDFSVKNKRYFLAIDSNYYAGDLSVKYLKNIITNIWDYSMGFAFWHIEYGDTSFYDLLHQIKYDVLRNNNSPRAFIINHFHSFRAFLDSYRVPIGIILSVVLLIYISFAVYAKVAGREKYIDMYKTYFITIGFLIAFIDYLYIITLPFSINMHLELIIMSIIMILAFFFIIHKIYKLNKAKDLP